MSLVKSRVAGSLNSFDKKPKQYSNSDESRGLLGLGLARTPLYGDTKDGASPKKTIALKKVKESQFDPEKSSDSSSDEEGKKKIKNVKKVPEKQGRTLKHGAKETDLIETSSDEDEDKDQKKKAKNVKKVQQNNEVKKAYKNQEVIVKRGAKNVDVDETSSDEDEDKDQKKKAKNVKKVQQNNEVKKAYKNQEVIVKRGAKNVDVDETSSDEDHERKVVDFSEDEEEKFTGKARVESKSKYLQNQEESEESGSDSEEIKVYGRSKSGFIPEHKLGKKGYKKEKKKSRRNDDDEDDDDDDDDAVEKQLALTGHKGNQKLAKFMKMSEDEFIQKTTEGIDHDEYVRHFCDDKFFILRLLFVWFKKSLLLWLTDEKTGERDERRVKCVNSLVKRIECGEQLFPLVLFSRECVLCDHDIFKKEFEAHRQALSKCDAHKQYVWYGAMKNALEHMHKALMHEVNVLSHEKLTDTAQKYRNTLDYCDSLKKYKNVCEYFYENAARKRDAFIKKAKKHEKVQFEDHNLENVLGHLMPEHHSY